MVGEIVAHSAHGKGTVRASRHKGLELLVDFQDGLSRWVRSDELQRGVRTHEVGHPPETLEELSDAQFKARRMVEAFRLGIVPHDCVEEFTFGRTEELREVNGWLNDSGASTFLVIGEYGAGKTHLLRHVYDKALRSGFAVAYVSMDPEESPFFKPKRVYARLMQGLRYFDQEKGCVGGFREFLEGCLRTKEFDQHPYFSHLKEQYQDDSLWDWISGREVAIRPWNPVTKRVYRKILGLYDYASSANIYCYLLSSLGWAATEIMDLNGLVLIFDEAEAIDRYFYTYQPNQGRNFLSGLIRTASDDESLLQHPSFSNLLYCRVSSSLSVPFLYRIPSSLKLLFSFTPGYTLARLPELATPPAIELEALCDEALGQSFGELLAIYETAYGQRQNKLTIDRIMSHMTSHSGRTRRFVKATVEALDLVRVNGDMNVDEVFTASDYDRHQMIRRLLKHAWAPFFGSFGRLTDIQLETIPTIMDGSNVVVSAPTASGKTEAVVAPVAERVVKEGWPGLSVLYIIPTRALGNDIFARLEESLLGMGLALGLKHGDHPHVPEKKNLPNFLITTPESLDSIICRRTEVLADVRTVILDELHLIDNTYRGDQLRILLRRLKGVASDPDFSIHILSATLSDPAAVSARYGTDFKIVTAKGQRSMDLTVVRSLQDFVQLARDRGFKKILCFCNKREAVEQVARDLGILWDPYPVVPHYGKLGLSLRNEAEKVMQELQVAICVATSTLEIGIDIGDIDLVFLAETPWSLSSFVQRIGRGKRRGDIINVAALVQSDEESDMIKHMMAAVEEGQLESQIYEPDISVAVQQVFSYLYQHKEGASDKEILDLVSPLWCEGEGLLILNYLEQKGWLAFHRDKWAASTKLMDRGEKGLIHSNIPTANELRVVDVDSGREVGQISRRFSNVFVLGHRKWQVVGADDKTVRVRRFKGEAGPAKFRTSRELGAYAFYLPKELRSAPDSVLGDRCPED